MENGRLPLSYGGMYMGWMVFGGICLLYFLLLLGVGMDFSVIWLLAGAGSMTVGLLHHFGKWKLPKTVSVAAGGCLLLLLLVFAGIEGLIMTGMFAKGESGLDYLVVLGAQVRGTVPSRALKKRLDTAAEYLGENPETRVVVSGGKGAGEEITEAEAMENYLLELGIEKDRIIMEDRSATTSENLSYTGDLIDREKKIGLVTNNFHIYRALKMAEKQGYTHTVGLAAPSDPLYQIHYLVREFFALIKAVGKGDITL